MSDTTMSSKNLFNDSTLFEIKKIQKECDGRRIGFTCSCFDLLHTGHLIMLKDAKQHCDALVVGLQTDPTIDRPNKNKPVQDFFERKTMIQSIRYIDYIVEYATEDDLYKILLALKPNVRIIGSDWQGKQYTGNDIEFIPIHWHSRTHNYSTSNLRKRIFDSEKSKGVIDSEKSKNVVDSEKLKVDQ